VSIDQQAGQQARLSRFRPAPMIAGIGGELISNSGPSFIVDQRRMLARVELILVRNLPDINRVREHSVDMPARESCATAFGAVCCPDALIRISEDFWTRVWVRSQAHSKWHSESGRSRSPGDRAERADQTVVGGEPVPGHLAGIHDVRQADKHRVGEPMAAQGPLAWLRILS
jgi:hypothetical protein